MNEHRNRYATDSGFYVGDEVQLPDNRQGYITGINVRNINFQLDSETFVSVSCVYVTLKGGSPGNLEKWLDHQLTRIG